MEVVDYISIIATCSYYNRSIVVCVATVIEYMHGGEKCTLRNCVYIRHLLVNLVTHRVPVYFYMRV